MLHSFHSHLHQLGSSADPPESTESPKLNADSIGGATGGRFWYINHFIAPFALCS